MSILQIIWDKYNKFWLNCVCTVPVSIVCLSIGEGYHTRFHVHFPFGEKMSKRQIENQEKIRGFMLSKKLWTESLTGELPRFYEKFGDMLIFTDPTFQNGKWHEAGDELWKLVCSLYNGKRIGLKSRIKNDDFRTPQARLVFGDSPHTDFKDNKIRYTWNIEKNMFCAGNITERHRIASLNCKGEVVVDLFAGIGYFTLPYLVHANAKFVHACEWNPDAVEALKKNLILNKVSEKCAVHFGDNREVCPKGVADRVNLGLIPSSRCSWETACDALLPSGGILYIHENVTSNLNIKNDCTICLGILENIVDETLIFELSRPHGDYKVSTLDKAFKVKMNEWFYFTVHLGHSLLHCFEKTQGDGWKVCIEEVFKVKSYAPHIDHLVFSVRCSPA